MACDRDGTHATRGQGGDRQFLQFAAQQVDRCLPDGYAFILLAAPTGPTADGGSHRLVYVSSMRREDAVAAMKEFLVSSGAGEDWMKHVT